MRIKIFLLSFVLFQHVLQAQNYQPNFPSLEKSNPVPEWFKDAKFGIYFHWGVYSVPAFSNEWYPRNMYMKGSDENKHHLNVYGDPSAWPYNNFITGATDKQGNFMQFAPKLKSEGGKFDPVEWAQLFADAGAKFAGPVAEHHDGFSMWASKANPWNAKDMGPRLDLVGLFADAIRKKNMKVILSMHHAFNITGFFSAVPPATDAKLQLLYGQQGKEKNEALWLAKHKEIIDNYKPDIIWQDFNLRAISQPVLLQFLAYYYNKAIAWNKEVVATYKDALNPKVAVLDYERGGPVDITEHYWLTDDAISSSSWCYTEGIGYYSRKQVLHGFLDRISKNGNLLLNISPKADGTIPEEQKDILLAMGAWLKKYGEAVYATRAWQKYGEGPTKMGAAHGVFQAPAEGGPTDVRYTRSKDNSTLYAILLGWEKGQKQVTLTSLMADRIALKSIKTVMLINGTAGKYLPLSFKQDATGLVVNLPERTQEDLAYVIKISFNGKIPPLDRYAEFSTGPGYYFIPGDNRNSLALTAGLNITAKKKDAVMQWKLESAGRGYYRIVNRGDNKVLTLVTANAPKYELVLSDASGKDNQVWKMENSYSELYRISNKQIPSVLLSVSDIVEGKNAVVTSGKMAPFDWRIAEVCELKTEAFKSNLIPGIIEAENFDKGCPDEAYFDRDEVNAGGEYRTDGGVDIEKNPAGGYNISRAGRGEWLSYTVSVNKPATYTISVYLNSDSDNGKFHLEYDGVNKTDTIAVPNSGRLNWSVVKTTMKFDAGQHVIKLFIDGNGLNIDKMDFSETK